MTKMRPVISEILECKGIQRGYLMYFEGRVFTVVGVHEICIIYFIKYIYFHFLI